MTTTAPAKGAADTTQLEAALADSRQAAQKAYRKAMTSARVCEDAIRQAEVNVREGLEDLKSSRGGASEAVADLKDQLNALMGEVRRDYGTSIGELEALGERMQDFSVTLFGRTMTGKSTLMEILTNGDGASIGCGTQRTTRDVRTYHWKGLRVTDVPGVAAFEGEEDEQVAYDTARSADLVLFLFTDDPPQSAEAEHLARTLRLGKPVLGLCNVKQALDKERQVRRFLRRDRKKLFAPDRLQALYQQFEELTAQFVEPVEVDFQAVHLRSRFLAQQAEYAQWRGDLLEASHFERVEERLVDEVQNRGKIMRVRTFVDGAVVPLLDLNERLLEFSSQNSAHGRLIISKRNQVESWQKKFARKSAVKITNRVQSWIDALRDQIPGFVQDNLEHKDVEDRWKKKVKKAGFERRAEKLQKELIAQSRTRLEEFGSELETELDLVSQACRSASINPSKVRDYKRYIKWAAAISLVTISVASVILTGGIPAIIGTGVPVVLQAISMLFKSREEKLEKARRELTTELQAYLDEYQEKLKSSLQKWLRTELDGKVIEDFKQTLDVAVSGLFTVADGQRDLADELAQEIRTLNEYLLDEALDHIDQLAIRRSIREIARAPGAATMLMIRPNYRFPNSIRQTLSYLFDGPVWFVIDNNNPCSIVRQAVGRECKRGIRLDENAGIAYIELKQNTPQTRARVRMAQQLTDFHIVHKS